MNDEKSLLPTPWDFKARLAVFSLLYGFGFGAGISLQYALFGAAPPTYALLGQRFGTAGIHVAAFIPVLLTLLAHATRLWGASYLSSPVVWSADVRTGSLLLAGPYRYVRNPLYLGNIFQAAGLGLLGPPIATLFIVIGIGAFVLRLISIEERHLMTAHGQQYLDYCKLVPRLLPRLGAAPLALDPRRPAWADAFWGEFFHFSFALIVLYNALFTWQNPNVAFLGMLFLAVLAVQSFIRRLAVGLAPATP